VTLVLFYHQLDDGSTPLAVHPDLFSRQLELIVDSGLQVLTASELAAAHRGGVLPRRSVAITFDDGFASAVAEARPRLSEAGLRATFFCVAAHVGGRSDWATRLEDAPVQQLAGYEELRELVAAGNEIGCHGWAHAPLDAPVDLERELVQSKAALAAALGAEVRTFAYPYGARPTAAARAVVERTYDAAFTTAAGRIAPGMAPALLPRVDAHYLRDPRIMRSIFSGSLDAYLGVRRVGSRARRAIRRDYMRVAS
jgi:peptidoglycan/xylan/chitin deacetylase (PgdA/CDA1 family)